MGVELCWIIVMGDLYFYPISSETCLTMKAFLTFFFSKGRQTLFQLALWDEEEPKSNRVRESSSPRVKVRTLLQRMCEFYQLTGKGNPTWSDNPH